MPEPSNHNTVCFLQLHKSSSNKEAVDLRHTQR
nr:MAG TPA: hypothetical protein [Caudoviricetes sp.]